MLIWMLIIFTCCWDMMEGANQPFEVQVSPQFMEKQYRYFCDSPQESTTSTSHNDDEGKSEAKTQVAPLKTSPATKHHTGEDFIVRAMRARLYWLGDTYIFYGARTSQVLEALFAAAELDDPDACLSLAYCFEHGIELAQDHSKATNYHNKAEAALRKKFREGDDVVKEKISIMCLIQKNKVIDENAYVYQEIKDNYTHFKRKNFGLHYYVNLDCHDRICPVCSKGFDGGDSIVIIVKKADNQWHVCHANHYESLLYKLRGEKVECFWGHALKLN